jgi:hypothetical protein
MRELEIAEDGLGHRKVIDRHPARRAIAVLDREAAANFADLG